MMTDREARQKPSCWLSGNLSSFWQASTSLSAPFHFFPTHSDFLAGKTSEVSHTKCDSHYYHLVLLSFCSLLRRLRVAEQPGGGCDDRGAGHGAGPVLLHLHLHHRGARGHGRPRQDRHPHDPRGQHRHQRH